LPDVTISPTPNGPYIVRGSVRVIDENGNPFDTPRGDVVALCRCGGSSNKPFCDGTHSKIGFEAATRAVQETEAEHRRESAA
jgi:CDGSH-type Zn-finger protein